ncbi:quinone oxidoreductase family protein [Paenibacillus mucilaginosus]|uniref:Alcohol dehydrogenase n=3 Tax=Paenibacillus mucilaginosus TaxID=61624 RepID=I0BL52_9BACL|nr:zinc-binding dehydrogenase [Paenibacillus mucilaginosus]AEI43098.1 quinone oxidoreductase [Paenibacillus mucilaginosus KNP414]AFH63099.1 alcohol dehydrogenase [Paenibacillus mucilaginosus K02]MCG7212328.1 zinc-binding dehydrogenase [Paenibacillus mucilaginosus]WDM24715.1 zinc-binding dehydrogenase [Paenibacillus mucilaginosus]WFA19383.1 alcohol dehydrogenase [Paenibacillus mucilaginosus]
MKAIIIDRPGGPAQLQLREKPDLQPSPGLLTIDVAYAGVGYFEVLLSRGEFESVFPMPLTPGLEVSGYVRAIGEGVEGFYVGQPVASMTLHDLNGFASMANVRPELTVPLDQLGADLDLATAAASIVNLTTAYLAVKDVYRMRRGDSILVHAAAGGLGSFLGQVARRLGAGRILGTVGSAGKLNQAAAFGYDEVFLRTDFVERTLKATGQQGVDAVFDPVGGPMRKQSLEVLRPLGQLVVVGNASGEEDIPHSFNQIWFSNRQLAGFTLGGYSDSNPVETGKAAREALGMLARKELHAEIQGVYPLEQAAAALTLLEEKNTVGKLVLQVSS